MLVPMLLGAVIGTLMGSAAWKATHHEEAVPTGRLLWAGALECAAFVVVAMAYGRSFETLELWGFCCALLYGSLTDVDARRIPNGCVVCACGIRITYLALMLLLGTMSGVAVAYYLASCLGMGAFLVTTALLADRLLGRPSLGGGDVKLLCVSALYFGWEQGMLLVAIACVLGIASHLALFGRGHEATGHRGTFPFGPAIAMACVITMLCGGPITGWYLSLLG